jgi:hypothetical protein
MLFWVLNAQQMGLRVNIVLLLLQLPSRSGLA